MCYLPVLGDVGEKIKMNIFHTSSAVSVCGSSMVARSMVVVVSPLVTLMVDRHFVLTSLRLSGVVPLVQHVWQLAIF